MKSIASKSPPPLLLLMALFLFSTTAFAAPSGDVDRDFAFAVGLYKDGIFEMAAPRFSEFLVKHPDAARAPQALYLLGECQFQLGKWEAAHLTFKKFLDLHPQHELADESDLRLGQCFLEAGRGGEAAERLRNFTLRRKSSPLLPDALYWLGEAEAMAGDTTAAENSFRLLLQASPRHQFAAWAGYKIGLFRETRRDTAGALAAYEAVYRDAKTAHPASSARRRAAELLIARKQLDAARVILEESLKSQLTPEVARICRFQLGEIATEKGAYKEAEQHYRDVLAADSTADPAPQALYALGWSLQKQSRWGEASDCFEALVRRFPDSELAGDALIEAGVSRRKGGAPEKALEIWKRALQKNYSPVVSGRAGIEIGRQLVQQGKFTDAAGYLTKSLASPVEAKHKATAARLLAAALQGSGDAAGAIEACRKGLAFAAEGEDEEELLFNAGFLSHKAGKGVEAIDFLERLIAKYPAGGRAAEGYFWLAEARYAKGAAQDAEAAYRTLIQRFPQEKLVEEARYGLAWALFKEGDFRAAANAFAEFAKLHPNSRYAVDADLRAADSRFSGKEYAAAADGYRQFLRKAGAGEDQLRAQYQIPVCLLKLDRFDAAAEGFAAYARANPSSTLADAAGYMTGWSLFKAGKFEQAAEIYRAFPTRYPGSTYAAQAAYGLADAYYNQRKYDLAAEAYESLVRNYPDSPLVGDAISGLQWCAIQIGDVARALKVADQFAAANPGSPLAQELALRVGDILYNSGDKSGAAEAYSRVIERYPNSRQAPTAYYWRGRALLDAGDVPGAIENWNRLLARGDRSSFAALSLYQTALARMASGDSIAALGDLVRLDRDFGSSEIAPEASLQRATLLRAANKPDEAMRVATKLIDTGTGDLPARAALETARCLEMLRRVDEALMRANQIAAERSDVVGAEAQFLAASLLNRLGRRGEAVEGFLKIKYLYGVQTDWTARGTIEAARLEAEAGDIAKAKQLLAGVARDHGDDRWGQEAKRLLAGMQ